MIEILVMLGKIFVCMVVIMAMQYICNSLFLHTLASATGLEKKFMAWIPIANMFYLGEIAGDIIENKKFVKNYSKAIASGLIIILLAYFTPMPLYMATIGFFIIIGFEMMAYYYIFDNTVPAATILFSIMCFINPISAIIKVIFILNTDWYLWLSERDKKPEKEYFNNVEKEDMKKETAESGIIDDLNNQLDEAFPYDGNEGKDLGYNPYQE